MNALTRYLLPKECRNLDDELLDTKRMEQRPSAIERRQKRMIPNSLNQQNTDTIFLNGSYWIISIVTFVIISYLPLQS